MIYQILSDDGHPMDSHAELDTSGITLLSRGGSTAKGNVTNAEYGPALRLILRRIASARLPFDRAWVDSLDVQRLPIEQRIILSNGELDADGSSAFTLMSKRMKLVGQGAGRKGGNSTKKIRIQFGADVKLLELESALRTIQVREDVRSAERLPAEIFRVVTAEHVWNAVEKLRQPNFRHPYGPSIDFDLITNEEERFPPKAVFGLAATEALGYEILPRHFSGGLGTPCFRILESAGFTIVAKGEESRPIDVPESPDDRSWTEGKPRLIAHLRRERASGLAQAKKDWFVRTHGKLFCERCGMDPVAIYDGAHGAACIEVHHQAVQVEEMADGHRTRLEDLQCLCANCHRVVHRLLKLALNKQAESARVGP
ncbi:HNH endonuclease [Bradyrhizobium diazoefficiens]|uniref:HNH endonuclease n=1 Tax=Bradyrhizobium diazoefficiens TaxID=1355477 RepID=UPI00068450AA|nr:HNH endonuclease [Bradyrhizobium diazoefficiens]